MADIFKNCYKFGIGLKLCDLEDLLTRLNLLYLGYSTVLQTLEICHYGPVCDVSKKGLFVIAILYQRKCERK